MLILGECVWCIISTFSGSQIDGNPEFTGDIKAKGFEPTLYPDQDTLKRVRREEADVTYTGSIIPSGSQIGKCTFSRVGRSITCELQNLSIASGGTPSILIVDLSSFPGYTSDYEPDKEVFCPIIIRDPAIGHRNIRKWFNNRNYQFISWP